MHMHECTCRETYVYTQHDHALIWGHTQNINIINVNNSKKETNRSENRTQRTVQK